MIEIHDATLEEADAILKIYDYYVKSTAIIFECDTLTLAEFKGTDLADKLIRFVEGFSWTDVKDIVNYSNETDRLYVKEI